MARMNRLRGLLLGDEYEPGWLTLLKWGTLIEFVLVAVYAGAFLDGGSAGGALILAGGSYACGQLLGFLFGHPRWIEAAVVTLGVSRKSKPSTNLEKVSDWLTTLIVGLTLIQFDAVTGRLTKFLSFVAPSVGSREPAGAATITIAILFVVTGFLLGYLYTRLKLQDEFDRDRLAEEPAYLEGVMNAYLYRDPPEGFRKTLTTAAEYEMRFPETANYRVYLQVAIARAQEYVFHRGRVRGDSAEDQEQGRKADEARAKCLEALADAYSREPDSIEFLHLMWEPTLAASTENDLTCLRGDSAFQEFFQTRLPHERLQLLNKLGVPLPRS